MHLNRTLAAMAALLLAVLIAACGGGSSATGIATATPEPTPRPTGAQPSAGLVADLEALIPSEIGGIPLQKSSMGGDQFVNSGSTSQELEDFLGNLGVAVEDVSIAIGVGASMESGEAAAMFAFRAEGANTERLVNGFKEAYEADNGGLVWEPVSIGGKSAERTTNPQQPDQVIYLYAKDDILFFLTTATEEQAAEALAALP